MSDYQSEVRKLLDFTQNVLNNFLNTKDPSQNSVLQRAMIETELRRSARDHLKFQKLIQRRQFHRVPLDVLKKEVMEYDDIFPFQRLSNYFHYYCDADRMDQVEFDRRVASYIKNNPKYWLTDKEKCKDRTFNRNDTSSKADSLQRHSNVTNTDSCSLQKSQNVSSSIGHVNTPEYKALPTKPARAKPIKIVKQNVESKDNKLKSDYSAVIQQKQEPVVPSTNIEKPVIQKSDISASHVTENKTNKPIRKENNNIRIIDKGSTKLSSERTSSFVNDNSKDSGEIHTSQKNKMKDSFTESESKEVIVISSKSVSSDNIVEMDKSFKVMEEIVKPQNQESKGSDKIKNKNINGKEQNKISVKDNNIKKCEKPQQVSITNVKPSVKPMSKPSIQEDKKSIETINIDKKSVDKLLNKMGNEKSTESSKISSENNSNKSKMGDKRRLETEEIPKIYKKSKINTKMNNKNDNIENKRENSIERIHNDKITLETSLESMTPISDGAAFKQFHEVKSQPPRAFEEENKNKDGNSIRLIQLYDSITKSDASDEESSFDSLKDETILDDSQQLDNKTDSENNGKFNNVWNNVANDENRPEENIPLNQSISNVEESMYNAYMSNHEDSLPLPTTINNFSDNDFKLKSILFGGDIDENGPLTKNPFITTYRNNQRNNSSSSVKPAERVVNKKVPKALKKMSDLVSKYNLDDL